MLSLLYDLLTLDRMERNALLSFCQTLQEILIESSLVYHTQYADLFLENYSATALQIPLLFIKISPSSQK